MNRISLLSLLILLCSFNGLADNNHLLGQLSQHPWYSGSEDCETDKAPPIEIYQYDSASFILRQNKCLHYEAPFIYVLFGQHTVFVQDTGATADPKAFPLFQTIKKLVNKVASQNGKASADYRLLVTHSHSHSDHKAADGQFRGQPGVTLIEPELSAVKAAFGYGKNGFNWPDQTATVDLGQRTLTLMPLPGHQSESVAVYDEKTQWLLTGDSLYPGRLYVKDWHTYKQSIKRLSDWTATLKVSAIMGTHIEMSARAGVDYKMGATYQPNEASLPMPYKDLLKLNQILGRLDKPQKVVEDRFIIFPLK